MNNVFIRSDLIHGLSIGLISCREPVVAYVLTRAIVDDSWWLDLVDVTTILDVPTWLVRYGWSWAIVIFDGDGVESGAIGMSLLDGLRMRSGLSDESKCFFREFHPHDKPEYVIRTMDAATQSVESGTPVGRARHV